MTELLSIQAFPCTAAGHLASGDPDLDRRYAELAASLIGLPEDRACILLRWRGGRTPVGIPLGGKRITASTGGRIIAGTSHVGVFTRTWDGGDDDGTEHEMLIVVTHPACLKALRRKHPALPPP